MVSYTEMDSWVYVLFGVLWIAFAIYKGNKKATSRTEKREEKTAQASSELDKIVDSFLEEEEDVVEEIPESKAEIVIEKPDAEPEKPVATDEGVRSTKPENEEKDISPHPESRRINLKQAIIYSEILRRPYE